MAFRSTSVQTGISVASLNIPVPASAAANDIAIIAVNIDNTGHGTITWPSGFTLLFKTEVASPDGHTQAVAWKRLTGADTGNYTVSWSGSNDVIGECALFSGRHTTNPPVASQASNTSANSSPISVGAATVTALTGDDLFWAGGLDSTSNITVTSCAPPSTFTERQDSQSLWANMSIATKDNVSSGATGTITGTYTTNATAGWLAHLVRVPAISSGPGSLVADAGSYTVSGTAASLEVDRVVAAGAGSYNVSGTAVNLERGYRVTVAAGSYSISGTDAGLSITAKVVVAGTGSYTVSGTAVGLLHDFVIGVAAGSYVVSGQDAGLSITDKVLSANAGSYTVSGQDAGLSITDRVIGVESGSYNVTGSDVALTITGVGDIVLVADAGSYIVSGQDVGFVLDREIIVDSGAFVVSGQDVSLERGILVSVGAGSYSITGTAAALLLGRELPVDGGSFVVNGSNATLTYSGATPSPTPSIPANLPMMATVGMLKAFGGIR